MPAKAHSKAIRLSAVFLGRLASAEVAGKVLGVDYRTVQSWMQASELPADDWTAVRDVLLTRGAEMAAKGETRGLVQTLTAAGISDRNVRYATLIARREARREAEQPEPAPEPEPDPLLVAMAPLPLERQRYMAAAIRLELSSRQEGEPPKQARLATTASSADPNAEAVMLAWVQEVASLTDADFAVRQAELAEQRQQIEQAQRDRLTARSQALSARQASPDPSAATEAPSGPSQRLLAPPTPIPMLVDLGGQDEHDRGWDPLERRPW